MKPSDPLNLIIELAGIFGMRRLSDWPIRPGHPSQEIQAATPEALARYNPVCKKAPA